MTPSEMVLRQLRGARLTRPQLVKKCDAPESAVQSAIRRLHKRGSITRTQPGKIYVYALASKPAAVETGATTREALQAAFATHPEFAEILLDAIAPPEPMERRHRVRRTPTSGKFLRSG